MPEVRFKVPIDMLAIDEELESELADYFARNGGNVSGPFVEVLWEIMRGSGHLRCSVCGQACRWHLITCLRIVTDECLPLHTLAASEGGINRRYPA